MTGKGGRALDWIANGKMTLRVERDAHGDVVSARDVGNGWKFQRFLVDDPCWCRADLTCDLHEGGMVTEVVWILVDEAGDVVELDGECSWPSFRAAKEQYMKWKPDGDEREGL